MKLAPLKLLRKQENKIKNKKIDESHSRLFMIELTDQNFAEKIQAGDKPVLVDFYALWCTPCVILTPILEKIADEYKERMVFAKANLDAVPITAQKYGIDRIPAVILFNGGKPISGFIGVRSESMIKEWLERTLKDNSNAQNKNRNPEIN